MIRCVVFATDAKLTLILTDREHRRFLNAWHAYFADDPKPYAGDNPRSSRPPSIIGLDSRYQDTGAPTVLQIDLSTISIIESCPVDWDFDHGFVTHTPTFKTGVP